MTSVAVTLAVVVLVQALALGWFAWRQPQANAQERQQEHAHATAERRVFLDLLATLTREAAAERRSLADRIQHPERVQVVPSPDYVPPEPAPDALEMAMVGREVPEFVHVGTPDAE